MPTSLEDQRFAQQGATVFHPISKADKTAMAGLRAIVEPNKGSLRGTAARMPFNAIMEHVAVPEGVTFEAGTVGGVPGWWCKPNGALPYAMLLHIHGGWFNWGSAKAYRNLVGHLAIHAGAVAFAPDYRLAPEHPFPAAIEDAAAAYRGLVAQGAERIVVAGDSAGGGLAMALLSILAAESGTPQPLAAAVMSPFTDLALTGASIESRAEADPIFTRGVLAAFADFYLQGQSAVDPKASPLYAGLAGLPPIRIDVGDDELLLDDSRRYAERARAAGAEVTLSVWTGMPHVFQSGLGHFLAAEQSIDAIGAFLHDRLA